MSTAIQLFKHEDFGEVRVVGDSENPRFCLSDVCKVLELPQVAKVVQRLGDEVLSRHPIADNLGRMQETYFVNEDGLYDVILYSRKPIAKKFRKWITNQVVPSIRKSGVYMTAQAAEQILLNPDFIIKLAEQVKTARKERDEYKLLAAAKDEEIVKLKPDADYCREVLLSDEKLTSELIAKEYGERAHWLHETLMQLGIMYQRGRHWFLKAKYDDKGYRVSETLTLERGKTVVNHYWTHKGRRFIYETLKTKLGIVPLKEREYPMANLFEDVTA